MTRQKWCIVQLKAFKRQGGVVDQSEEMQKLLEERGLEGITLNHNTIILGKKPSRAAVFEELIHTQQYKTGENDGSELSRLKCNLSAKKKLLKNQKSYKLTEREVEITEELLKKDEEELRRYLDGKA